MRRGVGLSNAPGLCFSMTLQHERAGSNPMLLDLCFCMRLYDEMGECYSHAPAAMFLHDTA